MKKIYLQIFLIVSFFIIIRSGDAEGNKIGINKKNLASGNKIREEMENIKNQEKDEIIQKNPSIYKSNNDDKNQKYKAMIIIGHILSYITFFIIIIVICNWGIHQSVYGKDEYKRLDKNYEFNDFWKKSCAIFCYCCNR